MHSAIKPPLPGSRARCLGFFSLTLALGLAPPSSAWAQKDVALLDLVPGDAAVFLHVRLGEVRESPWWKLLPADARREITEIRFPFFKGQVEEMAVVSPSAGALFWFGHHHHPAGGGFEGKGPATKPMEKDFPPPKTIDGDREPKKEGGECGPRDVPGEEDIAGPLFLLRLSKKFDPAGIKGKAPPQKGPLNGALHDLGFGHLLVLPDQMHLAYSINQKMLLKVGKKDGDLAPVLARVRAKEYVLAVGLALSEKARGQFREALNDPFGHGPEMFAMRAMRPFAEMKTGYLTVTGGEKPSAQGSLQFTSAAAAKKGKLGTEDLLALIRLVGLAEVEREVFQERNQALTEERELEVANLEIFLEAAEEALRQVKVAQAKEEVTAETTLPLAAGEVAKKAAALVKTRADDPDVRAIRAREISIINLKQIGIALHSFHDVYKALPPQAICDKKTGKPLLSWRVAILPYIEHQPLYLQFKLDESWDSPHNIKLLDKMPPIYATPLSKDEGKGLTHYQVFVGKGSFFELKLAPLNPRGAVGLKIFEAIDGSSNTLMVVESGKAVSWTKPEDIPFSGGEKDPVPPLGALSKEGFLGLFGDGSVRYIRLPINPSLFYRLVHRADGNIVEVP